MYECSPVDGFLEISEGLGNMIKSVANEPSVGLFYVQQHTHKAVPNLVNLRNNIVTKTREISLHTEDTEDSITMVRSMKECGFPIVDDMIKDITRSLAIMSTKQPKKGVISSKPSSAFQTARTSSWSPSSWGSINDVEKPTNYLSSVFKSAKQKATNIKWAQIDTSEPCEELPISSPVSIGDQDKDGRVNDLISNLSLAENFDEFKAGKEAKLEEWLGGDDTNDGQHNGGTV
ncbi:BLOC-1-related complex subunit 8 [Tanacetum coccineum]